MMGPGGSNSVLSMRKQSSRKYESDWKKKGSQINPMARVAWTPVAKSDLAELAHYIADEDRRLITADRIVDDIIAKSDIYANNPLSGIATAHLGKDYRRFI